MELAIYQKQSGNYNNNFPSSFTSGTYSIAGHSIYTVASNLLSSNGQAYMPQNITFKLYIDGTLIYTRSGIGYGSTYNDSLNGITRIYFPNNYLYAL